MSSHHFVKEGQEPALILAGSFRLEEVGHLLEWAPRIIAVEEAVESVVTSGIKVDVVLMDRNNIDRHLIPPEPVDILSVRAADQMEAAIRCALEGGASHLHIWCASARDMIGSLSGMQMPVTLFDRQGRWISARRTYRKWYAAGTTITTAGEDVMVTPPLMTAGDKLITRVDGPVVISASGLFWVAELYS